MLSLSLRTMTVTLMAATALVACGSAQNDDAAVDTDDAAVERDDAADGDTSDSGASGGGTSERDDGAVAVGADLVEQPDAKVEMRMFDFRPGEVEIAAGETVEFANTDDTLHTVTSEDELFDEELDGSGTRVQITFDEPGTYAFFCRPHNFMTGTVTVTS